MRTALFRIILVWLYLFLVWFIYRYLFNFIQEVDELLIKPILWLIPIIYIVYRREKRNLHSLGWSKRNLLRNLFYGWGIGAFFLFQGIVTNAIKYRGMVFLPTGISLYDLLKILITVLITAIVEETVFRGYFYTRIKEVTKDTLIGAFISTLLFVFIHIPIAIFILKLSPTELLYYEIIIFSLGFMNAFVFEKTKNISAPIVSHSIWNITMIFFR